MKSKAIHLLLFGAIKGTRGATGWSRLSLCLTQTWFNYFEWERMELVVDSEGTAVWMAWVSMGGGEMQVGVSITVEKAYLARSG